MRLLVGPDYRLVLPLSALYGGIYVLWADTIARVILRIELPLGVVTAFLGAPFFAWLLIRHKRKGEEAR
jgi:iron complex transport system permease protein